MYAEFGGELWERLTLLCDFRDCIAANGNAG